MEIAENGPYLFRADTLLQKAMDSYWKETTGKGVWHFKRTHHTVKDYGVAGQGKTISKLMSKGSKFPMMDL